MKIFYKAIKYLFICLTLVFIVFACVIYHFNKDLPDYSTLRFYHPPLTSRIFSHDGLLMDEIYEENRVFVKISYVPHIVKQAFIAAEDKNFFSNPGVDIFRLFKAALVNIQKGGKFHQGGSTITQQVVKTFFLSPKKSLTRKIKEVILAYKISRIFSKEKILELYLNQIYFGNNSYGIFCASLNYFNKPLDKIEIEEAALLAALPKSPSKLNPFKNYDLAMTRKDYVLKQMLENQAISEQEYQIAKSKIITLERFTKVNKLESGYYANQVKREVISMFGEEYLNKAGLTIISCMDSEIQKQAQHSLRSGLLRHDKKNGYRGPLSKINIKNWQKELNEVSCQKISNTELAVILDMQDLTVKIGLCDGSTSSINLQKISWLQNMIEPEELTTLFSIGDVLLVTLKNRAYLIEQFPENNGAIIVIEPDSGKVIALEGGYDFNISQFDRATQATRQIGSLIKPFIYLSALEKNIAPNEIFYDEYTEIFQGNDIPFWSPKNHDDKFLGPVTLRKSLEKSRNASTVRIAQATGKNKIISTLKKFGISDNILPIDALALGSLNTTLEKITTAYSVFANKGRAVIPHYIELIKDYKGNIIYKRDYRECSNCSFPQKLIDSTNSNILEYFPKVEKKQHERLVDSATNAQMVSLLEGVVKRGTAKGLLSLNKTFAAKTGTTNNSIDTWVVGFTPNISVGVFVGNDISKSLGEKIYGANTTLPILLNFMLNTFKHRPSVNFKIPKSINLMPINYHTGEIITTTQENTSQEEDIIIEYFK